MSGFVNMSGLSKIEKAHQLYHQAQEQAMKKQALVRYSAPKSLLLTAPNNLIFELFNTILREIDVERLVEYIKRELYSYLESSWSNKTTQRMISRLKREQTMDIRAGLKDIPIIRGSVSPKGRSRKHDNAKEKKSSQANPLNIDETDRDIVLKEIHAHLIWRINTNHVTQVTSLLIKFALEDGYKSGKLKAEVFDDVTPNLSDWRFDKLIKLYSFGNAPPNDQRLLLMSTNGGNLTQWIANYIDGTDKKRDPDLIRKLAGALRDKTRNCIYLTHDLEDAIKSYETGAIRCAFVIDREANYEPLESKLQTIPTGQGVKQLITSGKLYFISSLNDVEFAADPTSPVCC